MPFHILEAWGWNHFLTIHYEKSQDQNWIPVRVIGEERSGYKVVLPTEQVGWATLPGRFQYKNHSENSLPVVGDWLLVSSSGNPEHWLIEQVLPRQTFLARQAAGSKHAWQALAANVQGVLIATSANEDLNPRRLERYVTLARESGAEPVIVLTKCDLCTDLIRLRQQLKESLIGVTTVAVRLRANPDWEELKSILLPQKTYVLLGSSGVGKSSLVNALLGEEKQKTQSIREDDDKGRHTTTSRGLFRLRNGAFLIDTPGLREIQLGDSEVGLETSFEDISTLTLFCRFTNCRHQAEPGCAIQQALVKGELNAARWQSYLKQLAEIRHFQRKQDKSVAAEEKKRWKKIHQQQKKKKKLRERE